MIYECEEGQNAHYKPIDTGARLSCERFFSHGTAMETSIAGMTAWIV